MTARGRNRPRGRHQAGAIAVFLLVALAVVAAGAALTMFQRPESDLLADARAGEALGAAREALIAHAVSQGRTTGPARPGELPCPDMDNDGNAETVCATGALGRVPWLTLGIPPPKDGAGEVLWYAVALPFRNAASNADPINSDTLGNITVRIADSTTAVTTQAAAVLFAPGIKVGAQDRGTSAQTCAATGASTPANLCVSNYLEAWQGVDNTVAGGPFITVAGKATDAFNDRLLYVRAIDFIPTVEQRVGAELRDLILKYRTDSSCTCYPWAADWGALTGQSVTGRNRGRFPTVAAPGGWGLNGAPALPQWVAANNWQNVIYYSAGKGQLEAAGAACVSCTAATSLTVSEPKGAETVSAVLLTPGTPRPGVTRPSVTLSDYFEDPQNNHASLSCPVSGTIAAACDTYVRPTASTIDRDRIFTTVTDPIPVTCSQAGATLASIARTTTCGGPGNSVIPSCTTAVGQLSGCGCKSAASAMTSPPCYNVSNNKNPPKQCTSALTQLDQCK